MTSHWASKSRENRKSKKVTVEQRFAMLQKTLKIRSDSYMSEPPNPWDYELVYARYIRKNGKKIYPNNAKVFRFWVKKKPALQIDR